MPDADPARCPSCGAERPANAPGGLCPRCVLQNAMRSDSSLDHMPAGSRSGLGPVLATMAHSIGSVPPVRLLDADATELDGDGDSDLALRPGLSEVPCGNGGAEHLELLGEIARGRMGAVLRGRDPDLGRDLAVKVLLEAHKDKPDFARRFIEEAQIAGQLQHPGIVPVYELGAFADSRPYFAMKLVKGRTLASLLEERDLPADDLPRFVGIFEQVCRTMAYAHARGVIHRDLKPSNIMVGGFGEVQVMDWGLAKVLARRETAPRPDDLPSPHEPVQATTRSGPAESDRSRVGSVIGTPAFMAPEQARGEIHRIDARADVFALGAILYEVLAGRPLYLGRTPGEVQRQAARGDTAEALAAIDASVADPELIAVARDCLAIEPEDRPGDARAVAGRVAGYLAGVSERLRRAELERDAEAARAGEAEAAAVAERRARRLSVGLAAAVLLLTGTVGGGLAWLESDRVARRRATAQAVAAELARAHGLYVEALAAPPGRSDSWGEALAAARGAEYRLRQGEADEALRQQVAEMIRVIEQGRDAAQAQAARIAADRKLLAELESIRGDRADHGRPKRTDAEYAAAFRNAGLDLDATDPKVAGAWIAGRSDAVELASFLDDWSTVRRQAGADERAVGRLVAAACAADPNPWRNALRADTEARSPLALAALHKLASYEDAMASQPPESLRLLAQRLKAADDHEGAARVLHRAWRLRPDDFWVNFDLAGARGTDSGALQDLYPQPEEAVRHLTAALAVRPYSVMAHRKLGAALQVMGKLDEALAEYREAIRLRPDLATNHLGLGNVLTVQGKISEAIAEYREAIRLQPDLALAHCKLGELLQLQGHFREALDACRRGHELGSKQFHWPHPSAEWVRRAERRVAMEARLRGMDQPQNSTQQIAFGAVAFGQKRYALAARLSADAFRADPKLAEAMRSLNRFNAACAAALAGAGRGVDPLTDEAEKARWRKQAIAWLRADLALWSQRGTDGTRESKVNVVLALLPWKLDPDLAGIRDVDALRSLSEDEQKDCRALWGEVNALLARSRN